MRSELCDRLGIDAPIFAFTHCRDVVVAVSQAGGVGVQSSRDVVVGMLTELVDAAERLNGVLGEG